MIKKIIISVCSMLMIISCLFPTALADSDNIDKVITIQANKKIEDINDDLLNDTLETVVNFEEVEQYYNVNVKESIESETISLEITPKTPYKTIEYKSGKKQEYYYTYMVDLVKNDSSTRSAGTISEYNDYTTSGGGYNITFITYLSYVNTTIENSVCTKLTSGAAKITALYEDGKRNLVVKTYVSGWYHVGIDTLKYLTGVQERTYTKSSPAFNTTYTVQEPSGYTDAYFLTELDQAVVGVRSSVEYKHGTTWYTASHTIYIGSFTLIP